MRTGARAHCCRDDHRRAGVGKLKHPWLVDEFGDDAVELGQGIKFALDPHGIFNPGCVFEESKA